MVYYISSSDKYLWKFIMSDLQNNGKVKEIGKLFCSFGIPVPFFNKFKMQKRFTETEKNRMMWNNMSC